MTVTYDLRLFGEVADRYLPVNLGRRSSIARRVVLRESDPEFKLMARAVEQAEVRDGEMLVAGWEVRRRYTDEEMRRSRLVLLRIDAVVEPSGEDWAPSTSRLRRAGTAVPAQYRTGRSS